MSEIKKINFNSNVGIDGDITAKSNITAEGNISAIRNISAGSATIESVITAKDITAKSITAEDYLSSNKDISAGGNISSNKDIYAGGSATIDGYITATSITAGSATIEGNISITSNISAGSAIIDGDIDAKSITATSSITAGSATIDGDITATSITAGSATIDGDITATSNLSVEGDADIEGEIEAKDFVIEGDGTKNNLIEVNLGSGGTVGGYKTGDSISAGTSITAILKKLLQKAIPATYTKPTISLSAIGTTSAGSHEYGTTINAKMKATFAQNDAGAIETISFLKNGNSLSADQNDKFKSISESFQLTDTVTYTAKAKYKQGPLKQNNLGDDSPDGRINAGEITSSGVTFTSYRQGYFYGVLKTDSTTALTSAIIRDGTKKNSAYSSGNLPLIKASTVANRKRIFVACPADKTGVTKVIMPSAQNFDCTSDFKKQTSTVEVKGAEGAKGIAYNVWVYEPAKISDDQTFTVTLG